MNHIAEMVISWLLVTTVASTHQGVCRTQEAQNNYLCQGRTLRLHYVKLVLHLELFLSLNPQSSWISYSHQLPICLWDIASGHLVSISFNEFNSHWSCWQSNWWDAQIDWTIQIVQSCMVQWQTWLILLQTCRFLMGWHLWLLRKVWCRTCSLQLRVGCWHND